MFAHRDYTHELPAVYDETAPGLGIVEMPAHKAPSTPPPEIIQRILDEIEREEHEGPPRDKPRPN